MATARVLLALSSPLVRVRLRHLLQQDPTISLVGEVTDGSQAAQAAVDRQPQLILCDERILADPGLQALFSPRMGKTSLRVVVIAANVRAVTRPERVPVVAVLPIDLPAEDVGLELHQALRVDLTPSQPAPAAPVVGMEHRFVSTDNFKAEDGHGAPGTQMLKRIPANDPQKGDLARSPTHGLPRSPTQGLQQPQTGGLVRPPTGGLTLRTSRIGGVSRRRHAAAHDRLGTLLQEIQNEQALQRDALTGLANTRALGNALRLLPTVGHPAAVVLVDLWYAGGMHAVSEPDAQAGILRAAAALLRANTRQEDLICRLDGMTFAIVMPGVDAVSAPTPMRRIRSAMDRMRPATQERPFALAVAMGIGFWEAGVPPAQPLELGWREMVQEREAGQR